MAVDSKCLRGSRDAAGQAVMVLGAMLQDGTLVAQQMVADKGSEYPCVCCGRLIMDDPPGSYEICPSASTPLRLSLERQVKPW
ncbi:hypothetical protein [Streptomyces sp. NBC_01320]|uniref:hypothetical protein n=1 Tax=Streptomyces sp. NBC_01320 TaxID=2903824 RepID=UPI002E10089C|nr:hypothetical protein OG395_04285 [Streptomyces sp. NBC_01320]